GGDSSPTATGTSPGPGEIASANDTGPVSIITEDPTCEPWRPINETLAKVQEKQWVDRDFKQSAAAWTPEQRAMHVEVADAMRSAADRTVSLVKLTPNRVMRELYEQSIAYWQAYAASIPTYTYPSNSLAVTASDTTGAIASICTAISYRSATARGPLVPSGPTPTAAPTAGNSASPEVFLKEQDSGICADWATASTTFEKATEPWRSVDPALLPSDWSAEQRAIMGSAGPTMRDFASELEALGMQSENSTLDDFANLSAQYWRAFAEAIPSYTTNDSYLAATASFAYLIAFNACRALES
ncbi:MAG: hypothetical protein WBO08_05810, partial [Mycobacterium sp.]